jgi:hypothetical protein
MFCPVNTEKAKMNPRRFVERWITPVFPVLKTLRALRLYGRYVQAWRRYQDMPGAEPLRFSESYPALFDATDSTPLDPHYFYQGVWATERIAACHPDQHVDVASDHRFVGLLTTHLPVTFIDIRPLRARLPRLREVAAEITALPFAGESLQSISCLHVAEHIGLGRYGDPLNPSGTRLACAELARVLRKGGNLYFSAPVGRERVAFNAHRIHAPNQILEYFSGLQLVEFSAVDDKGKLRLDIEPSAMQNTDYACGLYWFKR